MQFRPDIQGLRAIAVASVVVFHVWPAALPGGFVGVDVFFVISGFLITSLLYREVLDTGRISLLGFYERRIRRIVPAATLVLVAIAAAIPLLPEVRWSETAYGVIASALYVENWQLALAAVDYLAADDVASPVQHYWSLSIEEQFYLVWPLMMALGASLARAWPSHRRLALFVPLAVCVAGTFFASIIVTQTDREFAYFATYTRIWELGLGGLLALWPLPALTTRVAEAMRLAGIAAIVAACIAFSGDTAFPGFAAALPTAGAALVIAAGTGHPGWSSLRLLRSWPALYLGDISYSVYLWHWPLVVFHGALRPGPVSAMAGLAIVAATIALAHLTKRFVEDPFRHGRMPGHRAIAYGMAAIAVAAVLPAAVLATAVGGGTQIDAQSGERYPGAAALFGAPVPKVSAPVPALREVKGDVAEAYKRKCHVERGGSAATACSFGNPDADFHVVLVGDSHATQWIPALDIVARGRNWRLTTFTKSGCPLLRATVIWKGERYDACRKWGRRVFDQLAELRPDVVLLTHSRAHRLFHETGEPTIDEMIVALDETWQGIEGLGARIVAIRDTPKLPFRPGECLAADDDCHASRGEALLGEDPIVVVSGRRPSVRLIDLTDVLCDEDSCPVVIGNVVAWRDDDHLTATYARSAASILDERLAAAFADDLTALTGSVPEADGGSN